MTRNMPNLTVRCASMDSIPTAKPGAQKAGGYLKMIYRTAQPTSPAVAVEHIVYTKMDVYRPVLA